MNRRWKFVALAKSNLSLHYWGAELPSKKGNRLGASTKLLEEIVYRISMDEVSVSLFTNGEVIPDFDTYFCL